MSNPFKLIITIISSLLILAAMYFGSYLPLRKSQLQIKALSGMREIRSVEGFNDLFGPVLDFYSPVGQGEVTSGYLSNILNVVRQQSDKDVVGALIKQAEIRMAPILEKRSGFSFNQNIYNLASIYSAGAVKFNDGDYYRKGVEMYRLGLKYSPNRPMFLYGLFGLYQSKGDKEGVEEIGGIILKYRPDDEHVRRTIQDY